MACDVRFIGSWGVGAVVDTKIAADPPGGDGLWYRVGENVRYLLPDANTLHYGTLGGSPVEWKRIDGSSSTSIIGSWRHEAVPLLGNDEGETMTLESNGTYRTRIDSDTKDYFGTFLLSQDANGPLISMSEYFFRLQTSGNAFSATTIEGDLMEGNFSFGGDASTFTLNFTNSSREPLMLKRF